MLEEQAEARGVAYTPPPFAVAKDESIEMEMASKITDPPLPPPESTPGAPSADSLQEERTMSEVGPESHTSPPPLPGIGYPWGGGVPDPLMLPWPPWLPFKRDQSLMLGRSKGSGG